MDGATVQVAVFAPLRHTLSYLPPVGVAPQALLPGLRVRVPLGRRERHGVVVAVGEDLPSAPATLKPIAAVLDETPVVPTSLLALAQWAADYYQHPLGDVMATVLPGELRHGRGLRPPGARAAAPQAPAEPFLALNAEQTAALAGITDAGPGYGALLLNGVTGSGKTEVYLHAVRAVIATGGQCLVLVPEIGLTGQIVQRFHARFGPIVAVMHSGLTDRERAITWARCQRGEVGVLIGTRSAVWVPMPRLRLLVVDEEHDASFKQQDGFRYSARDVAVVRARNARCKVILGSATPSLESFLNVERGKYRELRLAARVGAAVVPRIEGLDVRGLPLKGGLCRPLVAAIEDNLARGEQTLLFLNRRGYAPIVLCHACGYIAACPRCDARLVMHKQRGRLLCHHCGGSHAPDARFAGHACGSAAEYVTLGLGTEQLEETLETLFPSRRIARIDRDSMSRKGELERTLAAVCAREVDILLGTQMLAKGHDFAGVTLVAVIDADSRLFATDFRAEERFAQTILQVAGRAGRADAPGRVLVQTHHPEHRVFGALLAGSYAEFVRRALAERADAALPPYAAMAVLRAEATRREYPDQFLSAVAASVRATAPRTVAALGPVPAPMERRAGRFRANLLLTAPTRAPLAAALRAVLEGIERLPGARRVRWHLDVDPQDAV